MNQLNGFRCTAHRALVILGFAACLAPAPGNGGESVGPGAKAAASGTGWTFTGNLQTARTEHTATLLNSGRVLVVGGKNYTTSDLRSAELYDPQTKTWSPAGNLATQRRGHTATLMPDGSVLVTGGAIYGKSVERYDPGTNAWQTLAGMNKAHVHHTATLLSNGKVLVAGGTVPPGPGNAELYDPATGTWSYTGDLIVPRSYHSATLLPDGKVLVAGGVATNFGWQRSTELYDPVLGTWAANGNMNLSGAENDASLLGNGKVLITGVVDTDDDFPGYAGAADLYDPADRSFAIGGGFGESVQGLQNATMTRLVDGEILLIGGGAFVYFEMFDEEGPYLSPLAKRYDPVADSWRDAASPGVERYSHSATLLQNGEVLIAGGESYSGVLTSAELYDAPAFDAPAAVIGPEYSGTWYDPAQSGHGIFVEVLPGNRFLAYWFTFNPAGTEQSWFGGVGSYNGNSATINDVVRTTGGRWIPDFVQGQVVNQNWGTLRFTFDDASHGRVDFDSEVGFGAGSMSLTRLTRPVGAAAATAGDQGKAAGAIAPGYTGVWYDPAQSGHGIVVEVLPQNQLLAWWFTFNPAGTEQAWFGGVGSYSGSTATIPGVVQSTGGRWIPNFNSSQVVNNPWGTLRLEFTDCNHGRVDFNSVRGYGTGSMNLTRLTQPAGLACP